MIDLIIGFIVGVIVGYGLIVGCGVIVRYGTVKDWIATVKGWFVKIPPA